MPTSLNKKKISPNFFFHYQTCTGYHHHHRHRHRRRHSRRLHQSPRHRRTYPPLPYKPSTTIQQVASAALRASLYPTTLHSKPLRLLMPSLCSRSRLKALNRRVTMIAERPSSKNRAVDHRLLALQQVSRGPGRLHGMGPYKISLTGYSNVLRCPAIPAGL